jgi:hypothetical protein
LLTLEERKLVVAPSRAFVHNLAERMARAEASVRGRSGVVDRWVVRARGKAESGLERFFGEFAIEDCDVALVETRLRLRIGKVRTSFGPQAFDLKRAEDFVRQFDRAKATE